MKLAGVEESEDQDLWYRPDFKLWVAWTFLGIDIGYLMPEVKTRRLFAARKVLIH